VELRLPVYWLRHDERPRAFAPDFDFDVCARFGQRGRHVTHANADAERRTLRAAHHFADFGGIFPAAPNRITRPRGRRFFSHLEGDTLLLNSGSLFLRQHRAPHEIAFIQRDEAANAGFDRSGLLIQLVALKRVTDFGAECIARAQSGGLQTMSMAGGEEAIPN